MITVTVTDDSTGDTLTTELPDSWEVHNAVVHTLLVHVPDLGEWLHERTEP